MRIDNLALGSSTIAGIVTSVIGVLPTPPAPVSTPAPTPVPIPTPTPAPVPTPTPARLQRPRPRRLQRPLRRRSSAGAAGAWSFDAADMSGSIALDTSGNGLNGQVIGAAPTPGRVNQALSFDGFGSVVVVPSSAALQLTNSMTLSTWIKTTNSSRVENFLGKYDAGASEWGYLLKTLPSGVIGLRLGGNNVVGDRDVTDGTPINDGQWHHVAVVINMGQNVQFYIDGSLRSSAAMQTLPASTSAPLWFGTPPFGYFGAPFTGSLDSVRIDNQALSAAAIAQLAQ